jgi:hypothetical protein
LWQLQQNWKSHNFQMLQVLCETNERSLWTWITQATHINKFGEKYESACKEGLVWACLIHWTINILLEKLSCCLRKFIHKWRWEQVKSIWHVYFGLLGRNNDLNVLDRSPLIWDLLGGVHASTSILKWMAMCIFVG